MFDHNRLKEWFFSEQRDLPWRKERSPYAVWVSEMMLQQTQVSVVIPYFYRWMHRFPSIQSLAEASLDEVIKVWEGLGYYSRARYLHEGAKYIVQHHQGEFPSAPGALAKIKGLGPYTAGAIRSFAFHQRAPAVDGNVVRVLSRYFMIKDDVAKSGTMRYIWQLAEKILPQKESWIVSEALIELGAQVCTKQPKCGSCPLRQGCQAYQHGVAQNLPYKSTKVKSEFLYRAVAVIQCKNRTLVRRGQKGEIMSDLHEFPFFDTHVEGITPDELRLKMQHWLGYELEVGNVMDEVAHTFTRFRVRLRPVQFVCVSHKLPHVDAPHLWLDADAIQQAAFSSGHRRLLPHINPM